ncbi:MAG: HIT domain-containing protein [bacterium]
MEHLWSPWRSSYVREASQKDLADLFVELGKSSSDDEKNFVIHRSKTCFTVLNRYPYNLGHLLVAPYRAVPDLSGLDDEETADLWKNVKEMTELLRGVFKPDGINIGINIGSAAGAGVPEHMHVHIVPRWTSDAGFITAIGNTRIHPGDLPSAYAALREGLKKA